MIWNIVLTLYFVVLVVARIANVGNYCLCVCVCVWIHSNYVVMYGRIPRFDTVVERDRINVRHDQTTEQAD
jgi:hypothetical protein